MVRVEMYHALYRVTLFLAQLSRYTTGRSRFTGWAENFNDEIAKKHTTLFNDIHYSKEEKDKLYVSMAVELSAIGKTVRRIRWALPGDGLPCGVREIIFTDGSCLVFGINTRTMTVSAFYNERTSCYDSLFASEPLESIE